MKQSPAADRSARLLSLALASTLIGAFAWSLLRSPSPDAAPPSAARLAEGAAPAVLLPMVLRGEMPTADLRATMASTAAPSASPADTATLPASATMESTSTLEPTGMPLASPTLMATATLTPTLAPTPFGTCPVPRNLCPPCPACTMTPVAGEGTPTVCPICRKRAAASTPDPAHLPIGDGKLSSSPEVGKVWSCTTQFGGGGAFKDGPWIRGDGSFDFTAKAVVDGAVEWPHKLTLSLAGGQRTVTGNDLPRHASGTYPVSPQDDAYQYDRNPNNISAQTLSWSLPAIPQEAASASCVGLGPVGVMLTGAYIFNGLDALGRDAVAHEIQDRCQGHPERSGSYHYHSLSLCADDPGVGHSTLVGYALDGFGIYGRRGEDGQELSSADLDACHGHSHEVDWDGQRRVMFHYHATLDYPYTVGCYRGTPIRLGGGRPPRPLGSER